MYSTSGLHLCCRLPDTVDDRAIAKALGVRGIGATALSSYYLKPATALPGLVIGFGNTPSENYADLTETIVDVVKLALNS